MVNSRICSSETELLSLKGDFSELVKVTFVSDNPKCYDILSGDYFFVCRNSKDAKNLFVRQSIVPPVIDRLYCATEHLQFDDQKGIILSPAHYLYLPLGFGDLEYDGLKKKLESLGSWRPVREMTMWGFVDGKW